MVDVYMRDGRTVFRLASRGALNYLTNRRPGHDTASVDAAVTGYDREWGSWRPVKLRSLNKASVSFVLEVEENGEAPAVRPEPGIAVEARP